MAGKDNSRSFLRALSNAKKERSAWKLVSLLLAGLLVLMVFSMTRMAGNLPTYLVSYEMATSTGKLKLTPYGPQDPKYLASIAEQDANLLLTWIPENVQIQYSKFKNRMSRELYAKEQVRLSSEAKKYADSVTTSVFYPLKTYVSPKTNRVRLSGLLKRHEGGKEVLSRQVDYVIEYENKGGMLNVKSFGFAQDK